MGISIQGKTIFILRRDQASAYRYVLLHFALRCLVNVTDICTFYLDTYVQSYRDITQVCVCVCECVCVCVCVWGGGGGGGGAD